MENIKEDNNTKRWIDIATIQKQYLPLSRKAIRKLVCKNLDFVRAGNKLIVERKQLEDFLRNNI